MGEHLILAGYGTYYSSIGALSMSLILAHYRKYFSYYIISHWAQIRIGLIGILLLFVEP